MRPSRRDASRLGGRASKHQRLFFMLLANIGTHAHQVQAYVVCGWVGLFGRLLVSSHEISFWTDIPTPEEPALG